MAVEETEAEEAVKEDRVVADLVPNRKKEPMIVIVTANRNRAIREVSAHLAPIHPSTVPLRFNSNNSSNNNSSNSSNNSNNNNICITLITCRSWVIIRTIRTITITT